MKRMAADGKVYDYDTFMDGRLQATVMDPSHGGISRTVDLQIHYIADK